MSAQGIPLKSDFRERARVNDVPVARLIGFEAKEIADGRATVILAAGPQHANPWELCTAESFAILPMRQWGWRLQAPLPRKNPSLPSNVELKVNFFRPIWQAQLRAEGSVVHRGRTIGYVECDITDEKDRLVAKAASTCMVLRGQKSAGR